MARLRIAIALIACTAMGYAFSAGSFALAAAPPKAPSHAVVACYFHRTVRCPTCRTISAYIEEAIRTGFAEELRNGQVRLAMIDFENPKNQAYVAAYHITGPTLVLLDVHDGRVARWKPAPKVWTLVGKKPELFQYVQSEIRSLLAENGNPPTAPQSQ